MQCPLDGTALVMTERSGIEIDYCPKCRGVWLDRGELDKIIDKAAPAMAASAPPAGYPPAGAMSRERRHDSGSHDQGRQSDGRYWRDDDDDYRHHRKRRGGLLGEIFDF
ncbi:MAG: zf-TFIIB domain-containing protein [Rubellimicrobium sp.]|nr:zf-TFIIB domain-containing protein [Rubellimicrobium sp.]